MRNVGYKYFFGVILFLYTLLTHALSAEDAQLLRKEYQQYQAWMLSRNYFFGTTVGQDRIKALAWQFLYTSQLPSSYPQKEKLLAFYKQGLTPKQIFAATQLAQKLRNQYALLEPFTEAEMYRVFALHEENVSWSDFQILLPPATVWNHFKRWVDWLAEHNNAQIVSSLEQKMLDLYAAKQFPIVYGQVVVKGPEPLEMIDSDIKILPGGFFIGYTNNKTISFALPGYEKVSVAVNKALQIQGIPPVVLKAHAHSKKTGVVGHVLPWFGVERGNLLLQLQTTERSGLADPWYHPAIPLTVTNGGEFYTTGLSPGRYKLYINTAGISTSKEFIVHDGEIHGLSLIDLRKKV